MLERPGALRGISRPFGQEEKEAGAEEIRESAREKARCEVAADQREGPPWHAPHGASGREFAAQLRGVRLLLWLSASDTYEWAHRPNASWPCSRVAGKRLFARFNKYGDLEDFTLDGHEADDVPVDEFNAIIGDFLRKRYGKLPWFQATR